MDSFILQGHRDYAHPLNYKVTTEITPEGFLGEDERSKAAFLPPCTFLLNFNLPPNLKRVPVRINFHCSFPNNSSDSEIPPVIPPIFGT